MIGIGAGIALIVIGAVLSAPSLIAVGAIVDLVWAVRSIWSRFGLRGVSYERRMSGSRAVIGEELELELTVRNRKLLPVPWLAVEDRLSRGASIYGRKLDAGEQQGQSILRTTWTLGWFERVTRRLTVVADRRGVYDFESVRLQVADLFALNTTSVEHPARLRYRVVPRSVPVRAHAPLSQLPGMTRVPRGLFEDPTSFAGVRPYQAGDALRRVHWKATARLGHPVSRRYDPAHERQVVIALDAQTVPGEFWMMQYDDELMESLCTTAMSLARTLITSGVACGLAVNAYSTQSSRWVYLAPSASPRHVERIADQLADISRWGSLPFAVLLHQLGQRVPASTSIVCVSARDGEDFLDIARRLTGSGREVALTTFGPRAPAAAARARALGLSANIARLEPNWRTANALELVG